MKKALVLLSICMITLPLAAHATTSKKHRKTKHRVNYSTQQTTISSTTASAESSKLGDDRNTDVNAGTNIETPEVKTENKPKSLLDNVSGSMALTSNYMFRGISLSENNPAVQGGLTYTFPVGLYFNVWGSNARYFAPDGKQVSSEFDTIGGWQGTYGENFNYNLNVARYNYPGARSANYNEFNSVFKYRFIQLGYSYTGNYSGYHASGSYYNGALIFDIPPRYAFCFNDVSFAAAMGHYSLARAAGLSYNDYSLTLTKAVSTLYSIALMWTGTNGRAKLPPYDQNQIVGTVTAAF